VSTRYVAHPLWLHTFGMTWGVYDREADDFIMHGPQDNLQTRKALDRETAVAEAQRLNGDPESVEAPR